MAYKLVYHFFVVSHFMDRYAKLNKMEALTAKEMYKDTQKNAKKFKMTFFLYRVFSLLFLPRILLFSITLTSFSQKH